jgi:uncharacterized membrane protein
MNKSLQFEQQGSAKKITRRHDPDRPAVHTERRDSLVYVVGSVLIHAPRSNVWSILSDYDRSTEIFNNLHVCKVVGSDGNKKLLRQVVSAGGAVKFDYIVNLEESPESLISWNRRSGSLKEVKGAWQLDEVPGGTLVTYRIHLDGGVLMPSWILIPQVKGYLPTVLHALKTKVEKKIES